jgi:antitoxin HicB
LETALTFYTEQWRDLPAPSPLKRGQRMVHVPALSSMKFELYSAMRREDVRKVDLARRLRVAPSQVDRLLDIAHHSKVDQLEAAFAAIGKKVAILIEAA